MLRPLSCRLEGPGGQAVVIAGRRLAPPDARAALTLDTGGAAIRPGLVNAHDHLHRNHYPRLGAPPYPDAYAWGADLHARWAETLARARALDRRDALLFGALKNLAGGATTVVHHDPWEPAFDDGFPVRVARVRTIHSLRHEPALEAAAAAARADGGPVCIHVAEGTGADAAAEIEALDRLGLLGPRLIAVHAVGVRPAGIERLREAGAAVVWCPTSNAFLFGRTAPTALLRAVDVLLGTDALLTGEGPLLDELRAARATRLLDDARLEAAVGETAARRLGRRPPRLEPGAPADLVCLRRPLLEARPEDVTLVVVDGVPRLADERFGELFEWAGVPAERMRIGGTWKLVTAPLATVAARVTEEWPECARIFA